jgi:Xaa-Pro aminopeptidase
MERHGIDVLLASVGSDLPYLTGYTAMPLERLTMAVIPRDGDATLVVPELEAPRVEPQAEVFATQAWGETEDPVDLVAGLVGGAETAAIGDQTWSVFLLALQEAIPGTRFVPARPLMAELRIVKGPAEMAMLAASGAAADRVARRLATQRFSGVSERALSHAVSAMLLEEGCETAAFAIVAAGENGASPHHEAGDRVIETGDAVVVDFGGTVHGYHSDTTRTFHVGEPSRDFRRVHRAVQAAQEAGVQAVRPGIAAETVDAVARAVIVEEGYGEYFIHRLGHGIGLDGHEDPYLVEGNGAALEPGMAFSIEPGIYLPDRFGVRIEDIVVCTEAGATRLNESTRDLVIVE